MKKQDPAVILFCDSVSGVFIPQRFANEIDRQYVKGISSEYLDFLANADLNDPDDLENYWQVWDKVLQQCTIEKDGDCWALFQDGYLWLLDYNRMTEEEKDNFNLAY